MIFAGLFADNGTIDSLPAASASNSVDVNSSLSLAVLAGAVILAGLIVTIIRTLRPVHPSTPLSLI